MPQVSFNIGPREYTVACQPGEERLLKRAATMLDAEAEQILSQAGRMPEPRLLLLVGLMLADRMGTQADRIEAAERELARLKAYPEKEVVPVVPESLKEALAELAARAEALAERAEEGIEPA